MVPVIGYATTRTKTMRWWYFQVRCAKERHIREASRFAASRITTRSKFLFAHCPSKIPKTMFVPTFARLLIFAFVSLLVLFLAFHFHFAFLARQSLWSTTCNTPSAQGAAQRRDPLSKTILGNPKSETRAGLGPRVHGRRPVWHWRASPFHGGQPLFTLLLSFSPNFILLLSSCAFHCTLSFLFLNMAFPFYLPLSRFSICSRRSIQRALPGFLFFFYKGFPGTKTYTGNSSSSMGSFWPARVHFQVSFIFKRIFRCSSRRLLYMFLRSLITNYKISLHFRGR